MPLSVFAEQHKAEIIGTIGTIDLTFHKTHIT